MPGLSWRTRAALVIAAVTSCVLGLVMAVERPASAAITCKDGSPRVFDLRTGDPDGDGQRGGRTSGGVYVDSTGGGRYHACVDGQLMDTDADGWGAVVWIEYDLWDGSNWKPMRWALTRADGYGTVVYYEDDTHDTRNYHVRVCLVKSGEGNRNYCSGRG